MKFSAATVTLILLSAIGIKGSNLRKNDEDEAMVESIAKFSRDSEIYGHRDLQSLGDILGTLLDTLNDAEQDLGIRFNKIGTNPDGSKPQELQASDFPISIKTRNVLQQTQAVSVTHYFDCTDCKFVPPQLILALGGPPTHPSRNPNSPYWGDFRSVVKAQLLRRANASTSELLALPETWSGRSLEEVAQSVRMEFPGDHQRTMIQQILASGASTDREIIPGTSRAEFLRTVVMVATMNTWAIGAVGPNSFATKWFVGRCRPEEIAWKISQKELGAADGVPEDIINDITLMNLSSAESFTAYPEGAPRHPSWPAMHSAASVASMWMPVVMTLSESQICELRLVDYAVAQGRTVAGVHYPTDNTFGLNLGQEIMIRLLPEYLNEKFGSDVELVRNKIQGLKLDWKTFEDTECYKQKLAAQM